MIKSRINMLWKFHVIKYSLLLIELHCKCCCNSCCSNMIQLIYDSPYLSPYVFANAQRLPSSPRITVQIVIYRVAYLVNMLLYSSLAGMGGKNFIRNWEHHDHWWRICKLVTNIALWDMLSLASVFIIYKSFRILQVTPDVLGKDLHNITLFLPRES